MAKRHFVKSTGRQEWLGIGEPRLASVSIEYPGNWKYVRWVVTKVPREKQRLFVELECGHWCAADMVGKDGRYECYDCQCGYNFWTNYVQAKMRDVKTV